MNDFENAVYRREEQLGYIKCLYDLVVLEGERSPFSSTVKASNLIAVTENTVLRNINKSEQESLTNVCGCSCKNNDWSNLYLLLPIRKNNDDTKDYSIELISLLSRTCFDGFIVFDLTITVDDDNLSNENDGLSLPPGVHDNLLISDSIINIRSCRVYRNSLISRTYIGQKVVVLNCGYISSRGDGCDSKLKISVGAENGGGRDLFLTAESTMIDVARQLQMCHETFIDDASMNSLAFNIFSSGSIIRDTPKVQNVYLHQSSSIEASCSVINATLLPFAVISNSSTVSNVCMQWHATISDNSTIHNVLMMEHSHFGPSSIVESTVMGPDSHASAGEIHASVIGPNTNAHHQSLLISVLWPLGRGNVAYGANIGSNHTGRLPDQECSTGEGIFLGLSCVIKYPLDLTHAPYTMIAAGTKLSPQRIALPFSLIVQSMSGSSHHQNQQLNDIIPGWVIWHSPYTLIRNDKKYIDRRKATRHAFYTGWNIFRPDTIEMCRAAKKILLSCNDNPDILRHHVGECQLTEKARDIGIKAYEDCIQLYALQGLLLWLNKKREQFSGKCDMRDFISRSIQEEFIANPATVVTSDITSLAVEWPSNPWTKNHSSIWDFQRHILLDEFSNKEMIYDLNWLRILLEKLQNLERNFADRVFKSKQRDDNRGANVVPGYANAHIAAECDQVIIDARKKADDTERIVETILSQLHHD